HGSSAVQFLFPRYGGLRDLHAFPTRRSSDLTMWKSAAIRLRTPLEEGTEVFALGTPSVWEERTALRFNVTQVLATSAVGSAAQIDRKSTRLNSSHVKISYAVFCLKKKKNDKR